MAWGQAQTTLSISHPSNHVRKLLSNLWTLKPCCINIAVLLMFLTCLYLYNVPYHYKYKSNFIETLTLMEGNVWNVQYYRKTPVIAVPETSQYFKLLLSSTPSSSLLLFPDPQKSSPTTSLLSLGSPFDILMDESSSQPGLRQSQKSDKFEWMQMLPKDSDSVGKILDILPSLHVGISVFTMVHIVSKLIGSC